MGEKQKAFFKGGFGCLGVFLVVGLFCVLFGGYMQIDAGGAIFLFVVGGILGLVTLAIYNQGFREGRGDPDHMDENGLK